MSILKNYSSLNGFDKVTESYNFIINKFVFNSKANTFTHARHYDTADYYKVTDKAYKTLNRNITKVRTLNKIEEDNRALQYNYEYYSITELVILISEFYNNIEIYNLSNRIGIEPKLKYVPFKNPSLIELQLFTLKAIESFTKKSIENY